MTQNGIYRNYIILVFLLSTHIAEIIGQERTTRIKSLQNKNTFQVLVVIWTSVFTIQAQEFGFLLVLLSFLCYFLTLQVINLFLTNIRKINLQDF